MNNSVVYIYMQHSHHHSRSRSRTAGARGGWRVRARVERFIEPALLLALHDAPAHGYDLADSLTELVPAERIDMGNLYRLLRALEAEGVVESEWRNDLPGRARRVYRLTETGGELLDSWAESLRDANERISVFLDRYGERRNP